MIFGAGELGRGRGAPPGVNEAPVICGAVLSMRKASSSDDARPGKRRRVNLADHNGLHVLEALGQRRGRVK